MRTRSVLVALAVLVAAAACSSDGESGGGGGESSTDESAAPVDYGERGPYAVGTLDLALDEQHELVVFYPVDPEAADGLEPYGYDGEGVLGPELGALLPPALAERQEMPDTWIEATASADGPFPVVLHSHGFSGHYRFAGYHNSHVASWGYVVISVDHPERGLLGSFGLFDGESTPGLDTEQLLDGLELVEATAAADDSVLAGALDMDQIAAEGHSAGGRASGAAAYDPRIGLWIGQAPGAPAPADEPPPPVPSLIIAADGDTAIPLEEVEQVFAWLDAPKTLAVMENAGHNAFTDPCRPIQEAGGISDFVVALGLDPAEVPFVRLGEDGCTDENGPAEEGWALIDHLTVATLEAVFGGVDTSASLDPEYLDATFPGLLESIEQVP